MASPRACEHKNTVYDFVPKNTIYWIGYTFGDEMLGSLQKWFLIYFI
jgi:hypothetical protein